MAHGINESQKTNKLGYDYHGKRAGNKGGCNSPTPHKRTKKITHKKERRQKSQEVFNEVKSHIFYDSANYSETCPKCLISVSYNEIYGPVNMTAHHFKPFKCPVCGHMLRPCSICLHVYKSTPDCSSCAFKAP